MNTKTFATIILVLFTFLNSSILRSQESPESMALIVIDIQDFYFPGGDLPLCKPEEAAANAALLADRFRENGDPVIFIRHQYEPGGSINAQVKPIEGETVLVKREVNSFLGTGLDDLLRSKGITTIVVCGMQTHMCVEAAVRAGADLGYKCIVVEDACATRDLKYGDRTVKADDVHSSTLSTLTSYARVVTTGQFLEGL